MNKPSPIVLLSAVIFAVLTGLWLAPSAQADELSDLNDQSAKLYKEGKFPEAVTVAQQAVALAEKLHGPDHIDVATPLNNLGEFYRVTGRYADAEQLHKRALAIREKALGPDHPAVADQSQQPRWTLSNRGPQHRGRSVP